MIRTAISQALILVTMTSVGSFAAELGNQDFVPFQMFNVTGRVLDSDGVSLPGVNILERGTTNGTVTDAEGNYTINVAAGSSTLVFTFVGYQEHIVPVSNQAVISVRLTPDVQALKEVVVIGYGSVERSDLTGSVASITNRDLSEQPNNNLISALQGRAAGVQVSTGDGSPGGGINIRIRGTSTIMGSTEPLYIVDGFPVSSDNRSIHIGGGLGETSSEGVALNVFPNALAMINPADVESIEILKDAAATAIYGSRGANGVVIITTKRGSGGKSSIGVNYSVGIASLANKIHRLEGNLQGEIENENNIRNGMDPANVRWNGSDEFHPIPGSATSYDWQDIIYRQALSQNVSLTFSGGNEVSRFLVSGNVVDQEGIIEETGFRDYRLRMNLDQRFGSRISLSSSVLLSHSKRQQAPTGSGFGYNVVTAALSYHPLINPEWRNPNNPEVWYTDPKTAGSGAGNTSNPLKMLQDIQDDLTRNRLLGNVTASVKILEGLKLVGNAGIDYADGRREIYQKSTLTFSDAVTKGNADLNTNTLVRTNFNAYLSWNRDFGEHKIDAVLGAENTRTGVTRVNLSASGFITDELGAKRFQVADQQTFGISNQTLPDLVLVGFFTRLNYNYDGKYYVSLNARRDGSSVFGSREKWGFFPSVALAWRASEEAFFAGQSIVSDFKLRASVGQTGNGNLAPGSSVGVWTIQSNRYNFGGQPVNGVSLSRISNDKLKWETTTQYNVGFDARFVGDRFGLTVDYYIKDTEDLILPVVIPITTGFTSSIQNLGSLRNSGLEFTADAVVLNKGDFRWDINGNISFQKMYATDVRKGTSTDLRTGEPYIEVFNFPRRNGPRLYEGQDAGLLYGYLVGGVFADQAEADAAPTQLNGNKEGYMWYHDIDGNGKVGVEDQVSLGKITPDYIYGLTSRFSYKSFDLSIFFQGVEGNSIIAFYGGDAGDPRNLNYWTPENRITEVPINANPNGRLDGFGLTSENVQDGSYFRLKNVRIGYTLPPLKNLAAINVFVTGSNLWTGTKYKGYNPDVSAGGATSFSEGFDTGIYPLAKEITFGLNLSF